MAGKTIAQLDELDVITNLDQIIVRDPEETTFSRTKYAKVSTLAAFLSTEGFQALNANLTALSGLATTGVMQRTGSAAFATIADSSTVGQVLRVTDAATYAWGALDLSDADAVTGDLPFANLTQIAGLSVLGVTGSSTADVAAITAANDAEVLRRSGASVAFGTVATAGIADDAVTDAKLRNSGALSVVGRSANSTGDPADIPATAASDAVLRESGSVLGFGTIATAGIASNAVTDAKLRQSAGLSVVGRSANSTGNVADITATNDAEVLRRSGTAIGFGTIATAGIANDAVTDTKLRNSGALSVVGRSANSSGDPADISATPASDAVLRESGSVLGFGTIATAGIASNAVTDAKLRQSAGLSVIGRGANSTGNVADIAGADGQVLRVSGTTLGFGAIATAGIADDAVTYAKMQNVSATDRILGRATAGAGDVEEIACTSFARSYLDDADAKTFRATTGTRHELQIKVIDDATTLTTGDGRMIFVVPASMNGLDLVAAHAAVSTVSSSGTPTIQLRNITNANVDMLSTRITIDASEFTSYTAATAPVINASNDNVATGDLIAVDVDVAGTGTGGLMILLTFG